MITAIASLKGGTGKSTVNFNLAVWLATDGYDVKVFDLDPQLTITDVVDIRREEGYLPDLDLSHDIKELNKQALTGKEVLVDVGTSDMRAMNRVLKVADRIVVPVPPSQADVWSTQRFISMIRDVRQGKDMPEIFAFINRADTNRFVRETIETEAALQMLPGIELLQTRVYQRMAYRRSFSEGLAAFEMSPSSKSAAEIYSLANELFQKQ